MKRIWIFDIDGTLCESRQPLSDEVVSLMSQIILSSATIENMITLTTGSDWGLVCEQIPKGLRAGVAAIFPCSGNELYVNEKRIYTSPPPTLTTEMMGFMQAALIRSPFEKSRRVGPHIVMRPGAVNFSVVGRGADDALRRLYVDYDRAVSERERIMRDFNTAFPNMRAKLGGKISIDITYPGQDKSQVYRVLGPTGYARNAEICFVGDRMEINGNDYPLMAALDQYPGTRSIFPVTSVQDTIKILEAILDD